jgi:hypothetical protein
LVRQSVWLERQLVGLMPAAVRIEAPVKMRQEKIGSKIVPLKSFALGCRLDFKSGKKVLS